MSNYRVRQVLALGPMPDRQLRLLVALATWMTDDSRAVRVGFAALAASTGTSPDTARRARRDCRKAGQVTYIPGRGRGHVTTWTICCLPEKGVQDAAPLSGDRKGGQPGPEKGGSPADKRGAADHADQQEPEHGLNLSAKTPGSLSRERAALAAAGADEREIREIVRKIEADPQVRYTAAYLRTAVANGDAAVLIAEARSRLSTDEAMRNAFKSRRQQETDALFKAAMQRAQERERLEDAPPMADSIDALRRAKGWQR